MERVEGMQNSSCSDMSRYKIMHGFELGNCKVNSFKIVHWFEIQKATYTCKLMQSLQLFLLQYFNKLRENLISNQPPEKQPTMASCFESLMEGIDRTLLIKNRDR